MSEMMRNDAMNNERENEDSKKPPKYILHEGYLYKRVPNKEIKESLVKWKDLCEMTHVISGIPNKKGKGEYNGEK